MSEQDTNDLLNQGIEAAREGDKAQARKLFEQVLEADEENIKAWLWLYRVVDNENEKRICLTTVLNLDPGNEKVRQALEKLDAKAQKSKAEEEVIPGVSRRQLTMIVAGGAVVVVVVILIVVLISSRNRAEAERIAQEATQAMLAPTQTFEAFVKQSTATAAALHAQATSAAATAFAIASPTPTATPTRSQADLPPTWTPTSENQSGPTGPTPLPPPTGMSGKIVGWGGRDISGTGFFPILLFPLANPGQSTRVGEETGRFSTITTDGKRIAYTRYFASTFSYSLEALNPNGTDVEDLGQRFVTANVIKPDEPSYSFDGNQMVFVASNGATNDVFLLNLGSGGGILKLTRDQADYAFPALSPDGTKVAVVRNDQNSANPGADIVIIDVASQQQKPLTTDFGAFTESTPRWSPDGAQIVYAAAPSTDPKNNDIVVRPSDGSGAPLVVVRDPSDDIYPVFSPDGKAIAFASNRTGRYNIFVAQPSTNQVFQLTNVQDSVYPGGWSAN